MTRHIKYLAAAISVALTASLAACNGSSSGGDQAAGPVAHPPNILLVIMDDVGIDQMKSFGYGGSTPPALPNIDAVAEAGIKFRNTWGMPVCSPGRAAILTGRYPLRTGVHQAIGPDDLATSQLSPYEVTAATLLKKAGYESSLFGKFHLAGPDNNPAGNATPLVLGWDHFHGWIGLPGPIDTSAGGVAAEKTYACGFVPGAAAGGADSGACYYPDNSCQPMARHSPAQDAPGLQCLDSGGIFVAQAPCEATPPASLNFKQENAYYVSPLVIVDNGQVETVALNDRRARGYRTRIEADAAIAWIKARAGSNKPWMATVAFTAAHTPLQPPPSALIPEAGRGQADALDCADTVQGRILQNRVTEALDHEFGRLMVETGLASRNADGTLAYHPESSNTVVIVVTDNGTLGYSVKLPFDGQRAKGTAYQTGVWVPLVIAGPQVKQPGRSVEHMVNQVDLFQLFGELAGIDVHQAVPRTVDSAPLLAYLTNPEQDSLRSSNFTMNGYGNQANGQRYGPCVITGNSCSQIPVSKSVCEDNQGVWWGPGYDHASVIDNGGVGYLGCGEVNQALYKDGQAQLSIQPETNMAIRNEHYKLLRLTSQHYDIGSDSVTTQDAQEFYQINQAAPTPLLDTAANNLLGKPMTAEVQRAYEELSAKMQAMLDSEPACPGDGNKDGKVDQADMSNWRNLAQTWGLSSVYDFLIGGVSDGLTNERDALVIQQNMGLSCPKTHGIY